MLIVPKPALSTARLRFTTSSGNLVAEAIRFDTEGAVSHVEAVLHDGWIIGAYLDGGVVRRAGDYDKKATTQIFADLPMGPGMYAAWVLFLTSRLGWSYDLPAIAGLALHDVSLHEEHALICSALQIDALRHCGWWPNPLAVRYHCITPVVALLMLQADQRAIVHSPETAAP